jgi:hypothetical protein
MTWQLAYSQQQALLLELLLGTTAEMRARRINHISHWFGKQRRRAVYRRATLYVHCYNDFLMR